jgi:alkyl hydroperoxide reductase subunit AhpF
VLLALEFALASPRISAAAVEATEFAAAAARHGVVSVPAIVVNGRLAWVGNMPERMFLERLLDAASN